MQEDGGFVDEEDEYNLVDDDLCDLSDPRMFHKKDTSTLQTLMRRTLSIIQNMIMKHKMRRRVINLRGYQTCRIVKYHDRERERITRKGTSNLAEGRTTRPTTIECKL